MTGGGSGAFRVCLSAIMVAVTLTTGCISSRQISMRAVDYNIAAENARSEMLLLNVLRARDRKPMIFTGMTRISGSVRSAGGIGAVKSTGPDASDIQTFTPNVSFSDAPSFDVAVLDSQEFTRGIMTPVSFRLMEYLWDQGFPPEMLMLLVFERIDVECPVPDDRGFEMRSLSNDPSDEDSWDDFRVLIDALDFDGQWETTDHLSQPVGPELETADVKSLGTLLSVAGGTIKLSQTENGNWQVERPSTGWRLTVSGVDPCNSGKLSDYELYESKDAYRRATEHRASQELAGKPTESLLARAIVRSPQSVLFYLGEQTRKDDKPREILLRKAPNKTSFERRLFAIEPAGRCGKAHVKVQYGGSGEVIPNGKGECHPGRSMQALSLAALLLSLQQSSRDLPTAGTVRLIGQ